ncbi:MAG: ATP-binding cassette domain-containing protein, partial [Chloroflexota bacterium]|nr:ATP-binding cassette domain-containing protein [Chloroflexota bacterium]
LGDRLILENITFTINHGDHLGLVGANGAGKSTLLGLLNGEMPPDSGSIAVAPGARIGYLRQGFADRAGLTLDDLLGYVSQKTRVLLDARAHLDQAMAALADCASDHDETLTAYDAALASLEDIGGFGAIDALEALLARLGVGGVPFDTPLSQLSGGQKTRAGLAAILADQPDLLLLDEPSNHLDLDALVWLEAFLAAYRGGMLIVSHDRAFLDRTVNQIVELDTTTHQLTSFAGNYTDYLHQRQAATATHAASYERQQRGVARIERDVRAIATHARATERTTQHDFLRARAKKVARTAKVRERKLERLLASEERIEKPERQWGLALDFGDRGESSRDVAVIERASVDLGQNRILEAIDLQIRFGERIAVVGPNGSGKSTLLRLLSGEIEPAAGTVRLGPNVVVGQFAQEQETIDLERTVLDQARAVAAQSETEIRSFLHRYLFGGDTVFQPGAALSYGERARLGLALLVLHGANFLLLDEPLNHLDLRSREAFEEALTQFTGTTVVVLHDRYAIERLATRVIEVRNRQIKTGVRLHNDGDGTDIATPLVP